MILARFLEHSETPLWRLLDRHISNDVEIDVLSIDVEGLDYDVLQSNDWNRYKPEFVLAEIMALTTDDASAHPNCCCPRGLSILNSCQDDEHGHFQTKALRFCLS